MVSRATLHNEDLIKKKDIRIGDMVLVIRAGDVIPKVVKVIESKRKGNEIPFEMPLHCPVCHSRLVKVKLDITHVHKCINTSCQAQLKERIRHFVSKKAFDIEGLGKKIVDQLVEEGMIQSFAEVFLLEKEKLANLDRMAQKSASKLVRAIEKSKTCSLRRFIYALGIDHTGENAAKLIAERFFTLKDIMDADKENLVSIHGIGPETASAICQFFSNMENQNIITKIINEGGVKLTNDNPSQVESRDNPFNNRRIVLTGTLETMTRSEAKKILEKCGAGITSSLSSKTDFLIAGKNPGSKFAKAKKLGIQILDEKSLIDMLKEHL